MSIATINGVTAGNISLLNGISYTLVSTYNGVVSSSTPAPPPATASFVTGGLVAYWDPTNSGSRTTKLIGGISYSCSLDLTNLYTASNPIVTRSFFLFSGATFTTFNSGGVNQTVYYVDGAGGDHLMSRNDVTGPLTASNSDPMKISTMLNFTNEFWFRSSGSYITDGALYSAVYNQGSRTRTSDTTGTHWAYAPNVIAGGNLGGTFATNTWHHYVVTMANLDATNDRLRIYKDGVQVGVDTTGNYAPTDTSALYLMGSWNGGGELQRMFVGEVRRYDRELTAAEVLTNYSASKAKYGK